MTKKVLFLAGLVGILILAAGVLFAAQTAPATTSQPVTESIVLTILGASFLGMPLSALAELLKRLLKQYLHVPDKPWLGYLTSAITVAIGAYIVLSPLGMLTVQNFLTGFIVAWAAANGFYKLTVSAPAAKATAATATLVGDMMASLEDAKKLIKFNGPFAALGKDKTAPGMSEKVAPDMGTSSKI